MGSGAWTADTGVGGDEAEMVEAVGDAMPVALSGLYWIGPEFVGVLPSLLLE
jgi:hypothetical protein